MKGFLRTYKSFITTYPTLSNAFQTSLLMASGDLIAQVIVEKKSLNEIQLKRTTQFASVGFILVGPTLSTWYRFLSRKFGDKSRSVALKKVALDQLVFAPCFIGVFLGTLGFVQGIPAAETQKNINKNYLDILLSNYKLWPAVQIVNFYFVPLQYQVLLVQSIALIWNTYLSWKTQSN